MRETKLISLILILTMVFSFAACTDNSAVTEYDTTENQGVLYDTSTPFETNKETNEESLSAIGTDSKFEVHYIDVGQADATLIFCDDETMLIDGGNPEDSNLIAAYLKKYNVSHLNYVICSHAHDDHVGGLPGALSVATAEAVYAPKSENDIKAYRNFKSKVAAQGLNIKNPTPSDTIDFGSSKVMFLGPVHENVSDLNDTSIILKITYGETSFLFTGDAERNEEQSVLSQNYDLSATVLKVGHHGSGDSTTYPFLREIMPEYGIISVGENNYGHPTEEALSRLRDADVKVYRTDMQGDIIVSSNGKTVTIKTERNQNIETNKTNTDLDTNTNAIHTQTYIGNKNTKKFHLPSCYSLPKETNRVYFKSRSDATNSGFSACGNCRP